MRLLGRPDTTGFELEFDYIEMQKPNLELTFKSANLPENKKKNRYENVLSADQTRVKVSPDDEGSNYINANWISGLVTDSEKAYIATQGPLSTTEGDFWRMVWEQSVSVVLMLTREVETNKLKCHKYWPEVGETREYGQLKVKMVNVEDGPEVVRRTLELTYGKDTREVTQFQYIAWPDHGVPSSVEAFLNMANQANERNRTLGPQVVHCSAGLGRTGTYLIFHMIVQKAIQDLVRDGFVCGGSTFCSLTRPIAQERNHASGKSARDLRKDVNINVVQVSSFLQGEPLSDSEVVCATGCAASAQEPCRDGAGEGAAGLCVPGSEAGTGRAAEAKQETGHAAVGLRCRRLRELLQYLRIVRTECVM